MAPIKKSTVAKSAKAGRKVASSARALKTRVKKKEATAKKKLTKGGAAVLLTGAAMLGAASLAIAKLRRKK